MNLSEVALAAAITVSTVGLSYVALSPGELAGTAQQVADRASCRTVDSAIVAYVAQQDAAPTTIEQLRPWVRGDISAYRIIGGRATGPGC